MVIHVLQRHLHRGLAGPGPRPAPCSWETAPRCTQRAVLRRGAEGPAGEAAGDEGREARTGATLPPAPPGSCSGHPTPGEGAPRTHGRGRAGGWELLAEGDELRGTLFLGGLLRLSGEAPPSLVLCGGGDRVSGKQGRLASYGPRLARLPPSPPPPPRTLLAD